MGKKSSNDIFLLSLDCFQLDVLVSHPDDLVGPFYYLLIASLLRPRLGGRPGRSPFLLSLDCFPVVLRGGDCVKDKYDLSTIS